MFCDDVMCQAVRDAVANTENRLMLLQECPEWGAGNFCNSNPRFMWYACRKTCGTCFKPNLEVCSAFEGLRLRA